MDGREALVPPPSPIIPCLQPSESKLSNVIYVEGVLVASASKNMQKIIGPRGPTRSERKDTAKGIVKWLPIRSAKVPFRKAGNQSWILID